MRHSNILNHSIALGTAVIDRQVLLKACRVSLLSRISFRNAEFSLTENSARVSTLLEPLQKFTKLMAEVYDYFSCFFILSVTFLSLIIECLSYGLRRLSRVEKLLPLRGDSLMIFRLVRRYMADVSVQIRTINRCLCCREYTFAK